MTRTRLLAAALALAAVLPARAEVPRVVLVDYRLTPGPASADPVSPPNLKPKQLADVRDFLLTKGLRPPANLSPALVYRALETLIKVDEYYKRPIPASEWDQRIRDMKADFVRANGAPGSKIMTQGQWETAVDGMLAGLAQGLKDPYTRFLGAEKAQRVREQDAGTYKGIGIAVVTDPDGAKVSLVYAKSPAAAAGLRDGDVIVSVDGRPIKGMDLEAVTKLLRGPDRTTVRIGVKRQAAPLLATRGPVAVPLVRGRMLSGDVGYVYYPEFRPDTDEDLFIAIGKLEKQGARKLVLDLRFNPGGELETAESIASEFLGDKQKITSRRRQGKLIEEATTEGDGLFHGMPLAVLVNGYTASASEILSAALQDNKRAVIVGDDTYGKGCGQVVMSPGRPLAVLPLVGPVGARGDGSMLRVTDFEWFTPEGRNVQGAYDEKAGRNVPGSGGVKPDVRVKLSDKDEADLEEGLTRFLDEDGPVPARDEARDKAVAALRSR